MIFIFFSFHTQKKLRFSQNRPKTAPNTRASFSKDSFFTSSYLAPSLRAKKSNQVSPLVGDGLAHINYDVACERQIRQGLKAGLINGIITVSEITGKKEKKIRKNIQGKIVQVTFIIIIVDVVVVWIFVC